MYCSCSSRYKNQIKSVIERERETDRQTECGKKYDRKGNKGLNAEEERLSREHLRERGTRKRSCNQKRRKRGEVLSIQW